MFNVFTHQKAVRNFVLSLIFLIPAWLFAGNINGIIVDATSGEYLQGANIYLEGTSIGASTDREGFFRISSVAEGSYTLKVNYIGYEDYSREITVGSDNLILDEIQLKFEASETETIVSEGIREGQIRAINQQRMAPNIKNVVAREQMERFPDDNVANVVQRIPGIYISRSGGEGRYVHIRGTDPRLSSVSVNGEKLPSTRQEERYASLDIIGANQAASIEVVKALTPDMDGDAIGGSINIVTRNAFDYTGQRIRITAGSGYGELLGNALYQFKGSYSNLFGADKNWGLTVSANFNRSDRGTHGQEYGWEDGAEQDANDEPVNNPAIGGEGWALDDMDLRNYDIVRDNTGLGATLDWRMDKDNRFYVRGTWNQFDDFTHRGRWRVRFAGNYLNPEGTVAERSRFVMESQSRTEENNMTQFSFGGVNRFGNIDMDYNIAYSTAFEKTQPGVESAFQYENRVGMALSGVGTDNIKWTVTDDGEDEYDATRYEYDEFDVRDREANNENLVAGVNFKMPWEIAGQATEIKFGGKVQMGEKDRKDTRFQYDWDGDDLFLSDFNAKNGPSDFLNDNYRYGPLGTEKAYTDFYNENKNNPDFPGELDIWDSKGQTFEAKEDIYAAYAMATVNVGDLMILGGIRNEYTALDYTGTLLNFDADGDYLSDVPVNETSSMNHILPNLHFRYRFDPMTNVRLAFTRALARPNYWDLAPRTSINPDDDEIISGNPDLDPTVAFNVDLMAEHYFQGIGIASGGFFYKQMDDIIYTVTRDIEGGAFDGFEEEIPVNGGSADLFGIELNWNQQLTFLPGFLDGFGIYANYTTIWAEASLSDAVVNSTFSSEEDSKKRDDVLPGQAGDMFNFALSYEKYGFSGRLSVAFQGKYVEEVGKSKDYDEWRDEHLQVDFAATQDIMEGLKAYVELINITDEPKRIYQGISARPIEREFYSFWMRAGVKVNL